MSDTPTLDRFLSHALALIGGPGSGPLLTLGTLGQDGPRLRSVMLRRYIPATAEAEIHTDRGSDKVAEIAADPRVSLHLWDAKALVQLRLRPTNLAARPAQFIMDEHAGNGGPLPRFAQRPLTRGPRHGRR